MTDDEGCAVMVTLKHACLLLVVATAIPSVAHALELPGKLRLSREQYLTVQPIYFPGFTIIGAAEPLSIVALVALLALTPRGTSAFWLIVAALSATVLMHMLYWTLTAPVKRSRTTRSGSSEPAVASTRPTGRCFAIAWSGPISGGRRRRSLHLFLLAIAFVS